MKRLYGLDILKIVAMLMVVMLHVMGSGGVFVECAKSARPLNLACINAFYSGCMCAVDCFVLATGYLMCQNEFKYRRIIKLWAEVVFYAVGMLLIARFAIPKIPLGARDVLEAVMPVSFDTYWFFTDYVGLFFCMPFLNKLLNALDQTMSWRLVATGFLVFSVFGSISGVDGFNLSGGYSLLWFVYLYLVAGTLSLHGFPVWLTLPRAAGVFVGSVACAVLFSVCSDHISRRFGVFGGNWGGYSSPFVLLEALMCLSIAVRIEVRSLLLQRVITQIAPSVFSVYVLHSNPIFRKMVEWNGRFAFLGRCNVFVTIGGVILCAVFLFSACVLVDLVRRSCLKYIRAVRS